MCSPLETCIKCAALLVPIEAVLPSLLLAPVGLLCQLCSLSISTHHAHDLRQHYCAGYVMLLIVRLWMFFEGDTGQLFS